MGPLSEWVYRVCQVLYGLVLLLGTIWNLKRLYDNDRAGRSFRSGRSRTAIVMAVCAILLFPFLVPGAVYRFLALALFLGLHLLFLVWLDHHNQATRTGCFQGPRPCNQGDETAHDPGGHPAGPLDLDLVPVRERRRPGGRSGTPGGPLGGGLACEKGLGWMNPAV